MGTHKNIADRFIFREDNVGIGKTGVILWIAAVCVLIFLSVDASAFDLFKKKVEVGDGVAIEQVQTLMFSSPDGDILFRREVIDFAKVDWKLLKITYMHWQEPEPKLIGSSTAKTREELQVMIDVVFPGIRKVE